MSYKIKDTLDTFRLINQSTGNLDIRDIRLKYSELLKEHWVNNYFRTNPELLLAKKKVDELLYFINYKVNLTPLEITILSTGFRDAYHKFIQTLDKYIE